MRSLALLAMILLAACGADGAPEPVAGGIAPQSAARIGVAGEL